jgi:hypothetical protein
MSGFALDAPVFVPGKGLVRPASPAIGMGANGGSPAVDVTDNIPQEAITQLQGKTSHHLDARPSVDGPEAPERTSFSVLSGPV